MRINLRTDVLFGGNKQTARKTKFPLPYYAATKAKSVSLQKIQKTKTTMSKKAIIVSICLMASMIGCAQAQQSQQPRVFGESPLLVEYLDFNMNVREFFPFGNETVLEVPLAQPVLLANIADIPEWLSTTVLLGKGVVQNQQHVHNMPTSYISFGQANYSNILQVATFDDFIFRRIHMMTTLDYEIMLVSVIDTHGTEEIADNLLRFLNKRYGNVNKREVRSGRREGYILYWELSDRIIKFRSRADVFGRERIEIQLDIVNKEFAHKFEDSFFVWWQ